MSNPLENKRYTHICPVRVVKNPNDSNSSCGNCANHKEDSWLTGCCEGDKLKSVLADIQVDWRNDLGKKPIPTMEERIAELKRIVIHKEIGHYITHYHKGEYDGLMLALQILEGSYFDEMRKL